MLYELGTYLIKIITVICWIIHVYFGAKEYMNFCSVISRDWEFMGTVGSCQLLRIWFVRFKIETFKRFHGHTKTKSSRPKYICMWWCGTTFSFMCLFVSYFSVGDFYHYLQLTILLKCVVMRLLMIDLGWALTFYIW